ncbi:aldehyde dehydrogenase family protein [Pseudonocardia sp. KRD-291]|nr:aldehyde dehydrogenase family protein [Pseudonocardia sp. KRD291]
MTESPPEVVDRAVATISAVPRARWARDHRRRAAVLRAWADLISGDTGLAGVLVEETGKPVREARTEVAGSVDALLFNAGLARLPLGTAGSLPDGSEAHLIREPVGPTAFITPWNWPVLLLLRDLAPALAAGVTAVVKPSPQTSRVTRRVVDLGHRAGVPWEVLQVVDGGGAVGETMTRPLLELGGKAAMLVLDDADLCAALSRAADAAVVTSGQMCMACARVVVPEKRAHEAAALLRERFAGMAPADPRRDDAALGPLISASSAERITEVLERARTEDVVARRSPGPSGRPAWSLPEPGTRERGRPGLRRGPGGPVRAGPGVADLPRDAEAVRLANATPVRSRRRRLVGDGLAQFTELKHIHLAG